MAFLNQLFNFKPLIGSQAAEATVSEEISRHPWLSYLLQLERQNPWAFAGQLRDIVSSLCPMSYLRPLLVGQTENTSSAILGGLGGLTKRCPRYLRWLLLMQRSSSSTPHPVPKSQPPDRDPPPYSSLVFMMCNIYHITYDVVYNNTRVQEQRGTLASEPPQ